MDKQQLTELLFKYRDGRLSMDEKQILVDFIHTDKGKKLLSEVWDVSFEALDIDESQVNPTSMFERILQDERLRDNVEADGAGRQLSVFARSKVRIAIAACAAMVILVGGGLFLMNQDKQDEVSASVEHGHIVPGSDKARIVFDDGSFVELATVSKDTVLQDQGMRIYRKEDGSIAYELQDEQKPRSLYNTVITPKGGEYSLVLPDGSQVWVNADSKLRYPTTFDGDVREIELDGEAYFEVKKVFKNGKRQPFIVKTGEQELEVLGTTFNINSYSKHITTTLVEGSVSLKYAGTEGVQYLKPAQQSNFSKADKKVSIRRVDPYYTVAWKNGKFAFDGASIYTVMEDIARWYDVEIHYEGDLSDVKYTGTISRFENFKQLLQLIEWTNLVTFKVDGRRVTVMK